MIKFENTETFNWGGAIRGMRQPLQSHDKSDSGYCSELIGHKTIACHSCAENRNKCKKNMENEVYILGENDLDLAKRLIKAGTEHRKFLRQIFVSVDVTAPDYWWMEEATYKIGTTENSSSTMHTITKKPFTSDMFSFENVLEFRQEIILCMLNKVRDDYLETKNKEIWRELIALLPRSFNYTRTVTMNYETVFNMYKQRCEYPHKLSEWSVGFKQWCEQLPYFMELYPFKESDGVDA